MSTGQPSFPDHEACMQRCLDLAVLAAGYVAPNPMVGAVLVHEGRIIGEGYHQKYGEAHAEVNCIRSVAETDKSLIEKATMYVSLEPCAHHGKTPPCADMLIQQKVPRVVIGVRDPFPAVAGKGIQKLKEAGVEVVTGVLEQKCRDVNKRFFCFVEKQRPYIILKWARTADRLMAGLPGADRLLISNDLSNRLVHRWRSEESAILIGTNTARMDNPELTTRSWSGPSPTRLIIDMDLILPATLKVFDGSVDTIVFNTKLAGEKDGVRYVQISRAQSIVQQIVQALYELKILSVIIEGGAHTLQSFINENRWDEARVITNTTLTVGRGVSSPILPATIEYEAFDLKNDHIQVLLPANE